MPKQFTIPEIYRSPIITTLKAARRNADLLKKSLSPTTLDLGPVVFQIARHFGFCFGVENAIDIAYRALSENPEKRVFLLSEMIHNEEVNNDLLARGVRFLMTPTGEQLIPFSELSAADIVIVPAFGTTLALYQQLRDQGVVPETYDATCPFVEKVWNRSEVLGRQGYTIVIHGKSYHEETRATFSHAEPFGPSVVIRDRAEAEVLVRAINGRISDDEFAQFFAGKTTRGFLASRDLRRIGVVNQTTMLARETTEIAALLRDAIVARYGVDAIGANFADTRDTLCYATNQNQDAVEALVELGGDCAIVVGGYNSSNTTQLVKICESSVPVYHVKDAGELLSIDLIRHFHGPSRRVIETPNWLPSARPLTILVTAGASCPDALVDAVITRVASFMGVAGEIPRAIKSSLSSAS